jgi:uncharacterized protein DUF1918
MPARVKEASAPVARPGDRIIVESEKVGTPPREGEILEVSETPVGPTFEVRWDDGRQTGFRPKWGSARIISAKPRAKG